MRKLLLPANLVLIAIFSVAILFVACEENPITSNNDITTIKGKIVDQNTTPVPGAILNVIDQATSAPKNLFSDTTDEDGNFLFTDLPLDMSKLSVKITHPDFKPLTDNLLDFRSKTSAPVILQYHDSCNGTIKISAFKSSDSSALSGVEIRLFRGTLIRKDTTSAHGYFVFHHICPGTYIVRLYKSGYGLIYDSVHIAADDSVSLKYYKTANHQDTCCNGVLTFTPKDSTTGQPLSGTSVKLYKGSTLLNTFTYQGTAITFTGLCEDTYYIHLDKTGYTGYGFGVNIHCNDTLDISRGMLQAHATDTCCKGILKIFLKDRHSNSSLTHSATIGIYRNDTLIQTQTTTNYTYFSNLCTGNYTIRISSSYYESQSFSYTSHCNAFDTTTRYLVATGNDSCCKGKIVVNVKDSLSGDAIDSCYVGLSQNGKTITQSYTQNGSVTFSNICPGTFSLYYTKKDWYRPEAMNWNVTMGCNDTVSFTKTMISYSQCCNGTISGTVTDSTSGDRLDSVVVYLSLNGAHIANMKTDANGNFSFTGICPGTYTLYFGLAGYNSKGISAFTVGCNDTSTNLNVKMIKK